MLDDLMLFLSTVSSKTAPPPRRLLFNGGGAIPPRGNCYRGDGAATLNALGSARTFAIRSALRLSSRL